MPGPIRPEEIDKKIPETVFQVFNEFITRTWNGHEAVVRQDDVVEAITRRASISRDDIFSKHYLDIEEPYRQAGWDVKYEKPGYCETGPALFTFKKRGDGGFSPAPIV